jgi:Fe-S oxidoreductase
LRHYGTPKSIANRFDFTLADNQALAYECSLCGLCTSVCPEKLDPASLFLGVRRLCREAGNLDESKYSSILGYEKKGTSRYFSWYGLPEGCDTIFFPGCTLPGTRPEVTTGLYRQIRQMIPTVGIVLDCCTKPSHDLGRSEHFNKMFGEMHGYLLSQGIQTVVTACPNCTKVFRQYGHGLRVKTVYDILPSPASADYLIGNGRDITVHDPCL